MRLALDEDVSHRLARVLRSSGHDVASATELNCLGLTDPQVLLHALDAGQTLITQNSKDFEALHEAWVSWRRRWEIEVERLHGRALALSGHLGVLIMPHLPITMLAPAIDGLATSGVPVTDRLLSWTPERGWIEIRF